MRYLVEMLEITCAAAIAEAQDKFDLTLNREVVTGMLAILTDCMSEKADDGNLSKEIYELILPLVLKRLEVE